MKKILFILALAAAIVAPAKTYAENLIFEPLSIQNNYYESIEYLGEDYKNPIKAIFTDIENILEIKSDSKYSISEDAKITAKKLKGIEFPLILMTDKSVTQAKNIAEQMGIRDSYIIGNNGAIIVDEYDSTIYIDGISKRDLDRILTDVKSFNNYYKTLSKGFFYANKKLYVFNNINLPYISDTPIIIKNTKDLGYDFITTQISFYEPNAKTFRSLKRYLVKRYGDNFNIYTSENCYINMVSKSATKTNAIVKLSEKFGYSISNIATFGYDIDDIDYLRFIKVNGGLPITAKSAPQKVKQASSYAIDTNEYNFFSRGVNAILKNNDMIDYSMKNKIEF